MISPVVLDASALLAHLLDEPGCEIVADEIAIGAVISAANLAEVLTRLTERDADADPVALLLGLVEMGLIEGAVEVEPVTLEDAVEIARLRPLSRKAGLSLGDRACIATARRLEAAALTADTAWDGLPLGVELRQIR